MNVNRRDALKLLGGGAGAAGAAAAGLPFAAHAQGQAGAGDDVDDADGAPEPTQAERLQGAGFYRFKVGQVEAAIVSDGTFPLPAPHPLFGANASRAEVERALAAAFIPPDRVAAHVNALLLRTANDVILVDTGCGPAYSPTTGRLTRHLANLGVEPGDVSVVILTHAHPDHVGGLLGRGPAGDEVAFPHARFFAHADELKFWAGGAPDLSRSTAPPELKRSAAAAAAKMLGAIHERVEVFTEGTRMPAGIRIVHAPGHTPGHCALLVASGDAQLLYVADAAHHAAINLPHPDWHVAFDADPAQAARSRRALLDRAAADRVLVSGSHLPFPAVGHVRAQGRGFEWAPAVWEW